MSRATAIFGLPKVEKSDRASVTQNGLSDEEMLQLRKDNPELHAVIAEGLERVAPHNPALKERVRDFIGELLATISTTNNGIALTQAHPELLLPAVDEQT